MTERQPDELATVEPAKILERDSREHEKREGPLILTMELDDPDHPLNFHFGRKCFQAALVTLMTMSAAFSSSIFSGSAIVFADIYDLSFEVSILSVALFTLGFAFGPPIWGPMSEVVGRNIPYWIAYGLFVACHFLVGFAPNAAAVLVGRFLEGLFGSVCLVLVTASVSDMFEPKQRGYFTAAGVGISKSPIPKKDANHQSSQVRHSGLSLDHS
ncbi:major facilitator superfamily domain-containing protein [Protomyces lactucae-debilis]|uniref:Major facilitator superfamily domain-containing protein n=1 Tax=Protomyces lactucae-debilis TaxID=2754530 RepID=A0A1Y2FAL5_PROLT|nr:major facilitator superfamily domain-containing protein [Protomyces lactucae-debilis]ORY80933.1 major facilitator superfamily domain-containing protein [Protomyces lactucae-debilis]